MSDESTDKKTAKKAAASEPASDPTVKVRILANGVRVAGGVAAKGRVVNVKKSQAEALQSLKQAKIVGV